MRFYKYHALGNDYVILNPEELGGELSESQIRLICHRNFGIGSDGILLGPLPTEKALFGLRIFNPDGSEAEKSGNGLRMFARYLWDLGLAGAEPFLIDTLGGIVRAQVHEGGHCVTVDMGQVSFQSEKIPVTGPPREVLNEIITAAGEEFRFCAATIGNPHCVIPCREVSAEMARRFGPFIENDPRFPHRINVQFMQVLDRGNIRIEIWERGAGYTLASGSSSSAAAAVAFRLGDCDSHMKVHMPGGVIEIQISPDLFVTMTGAVTRVAEGTMGDEMFSQPLSSLTHLNSVFYNNFNRVCRSFLSYSAHPSFSPSALFHQTARISHITKNIPAMPGQLDTWAARRPPQCPLPMKLNR